MGVNSLPKTVTRQRRGCDLNQGPSAPESSTLTTRLPSHSIATHRNKLCSHGKSTPESDRFETQHPNLTDADFSRLRHIPTPIWMAALEKSLTRGSRAGVMALEMRFSDSYS